METKLKYITFNVKKCTGAYEGRTCSPYDYPRYSKCTVPVRKVFCKYKKIISKNCRINDMSKFINSELLFPMNRSEYRNLLIKLTENSASFFDSFLKMSGNHDISIFRLVSYSIQGNCRIIQAMIHNETEKSYSIDIKKHVKILKMNFIICNQILKRTNDVCKDWMIASVVENVEIYLSHLRAICIFIYLIIFKKKSTVVNTLLPAVSRQISKIYICAICYQPEVACMCFADKESTFDKNHDNDDGDYFSPETVKNLENENVPHCLKSIAHAEIKKSERDYEESGTDTD